MLHDLISVKESTEPLTQMSAVSKITPVSIKQSAEPLSHGLVISKKS